MNRIVYITDEKQINMCGKGGVKYFTKDYQVFTKIKGKVDADFVELKNATDYHDLAIHWVEKFNSLIEKDRVDKNWLFKIYTNLEGGAISEIANVMCVAEWFSSYLQQYMGQNIEVVCFSNKNTTIDCEILKIIARKNGIKFVKRKDKIINCLKKAIYSRKIWSIFRTIRKVIKLIWHDNNQNIDIRTVHEKSYGIFIDSDNVKHANWRLNPTLYIARQVSSIVICTNKIIAEIFENNGIATDNIFEYRMGIRKILGSLLSYLKYLCIYERKLKNISVSYYNYDFSTVYRGIVRNFINAEVWEKFVVDLYLSQTLSKYRFKVFNYFFVFDSIANSIFSCLNDNNTIFIVIDCNPNQLFTFDIYKILPTRARLDYYISPLSQYTNKQISYWNNNGANTKHLIIHGGIHDSVNVNRSMKSKVHRVLWAPSLLRAGLSRIYDGIKFNDIVIDRLSGRKDVELRIKYHAGERHYIKSELFRKFNGVVYGENESIISAVSWADIVITTTSTVMLDSALQGKLVVAYNDSLGLDLDLSFKDGFVFSKDVDMLFSEIEKIIENTEEYSRLVDRQMDVIRNNICKYDAYEETANYVKKMVEEY